MSDRRKEKRPVTYWNAKRIRALRERYGESQPRFAARLRVHADTLRWWEHGRGSPSGPAEALLDRLQEDAELGQIRSHPDDTLAPV